MFKASMVFKAKEVSWLGNIFFAEFKEESWIKLLKWSLRSLTITAVVTLLNSIFVEMWSVRKQVIQ
jgi:hypothetical protein